MSSIFMFALSMNGWQCITTTFVAHSLINIQFWTAGMSILSGRLLLKMLKRHLTIGCLSRVYLQRSPYDESMRSGLAGIHRKRACRQAPRALVRFRSRPRGEYPGGRLPVHAYRHDPGGPLHQLARDRQVNVSSGDMRSCKRGAYAGVPRQLPRLPQGTPGADAGIVTPRLGALIAATGQTAAGAHLSGAMNNCRKLPPNPADARSIGSVHYLTSRPSLDSPPHPVDNTPRK